MYGVGYKNIDTRNKSRVFFFDSESSKIVRPQVIDSGSAPTTLV